MFNLLIACIIAGHATAPAPKLKPWTMAEKIEYLAAWDTTLPAPDMPMKPELKG